VERARDGRTGGRARERGRADGGMPNGLRAAGSSGGVDGGIEQGFEAARLEAARLEAVRRERDGGRRRRGTVVGGPDHGTRRDGRRRDRVREQRLDTGDGGATRGGSGLKWPDPTPSRRRCRGAGEAGADGREVDRARMEALKRIDGLFFWNFGSLELPTGARRWRPPGRGPPQAGGAGGKLSRS